MAQTWVTSAGLARHEAFLAADQLSRVEASRSLYVCGESQQVGSMVRREGDRLGWVVIAGVAPIVEVGQQINNVLVEVGTGRIAAGSESTDLTLGHLATEAEEGIFERVASFYVELEAPMPFDFEGDVPSQLEECTVVAAGCKLHLSDRVPLPAQPSANVSLRQFLPHRFRPAPQTAISTLDYRVHMVEGGSVMVSAETCLLPKPGEELPLFPSMRQYVPGLDGYIKSQNRVDLLAASSLADTVTEVTALMHLAQAETVDK